MASKDATIYICDRCGKEAIKDWDAGVPEDWTAVTVSEVNDYDWCEADAVELCDECSRQFASWWNKFAKEETEEEK